MKKSLIFKILYIQTVILISLALVFIALKETVPDLIPLIQQGDPDAIQAYLRGTGTFKSILCTALLQMVQVWSLVISGMPIQVAAGCVFGFFMAFVICHLSSVAAHCIAIVVWRRTGRKLEKWLPIDLEGNGRLNEFLNSKAPPSYIIILACMIPVIPNGVIPLLASKMDISVRRFTLSVWFGSILNIIFCCAIGNRIMHGNWLVSILFILILVAISACMWIFRTSILALYYKYFGRD